MKLQFDSPGLGDTDPRSGYWVGWKTFLGLYFFFFFLMLLKIKYSNILIILSILTHFKYVSYVKKK